MTHKMSKESASSLASAYGQVAKYREAFDIALKYILILSDSKTSSSDREWILNDFYLELESKGIEYE